LEKIMSILSDREIRELCTGNYSTDIIEPINPELARVITTIDNCGRPMIEPFVGESVRLNDARQKITSYGLSSYGYDIRLADEFKLFSMPCDGRVIDIKNYDEEKVCQSFISPTGVVIPPGGLLLGRTIEYFRIPRSVLGICLGKSTYARVGALVNITPLEPEWEGHLVVEITNGTNLPLKVYPYEGIAQLIFLHGSGCMVSYADRGGKYQNQEGVKGSIL
jgi:dCTP deaminase